MAINIVMENNRMIQDRNTVAKLLSDKEVDENPGLLVEEYIKIVDVTTQKVILSSRV